VTLFVLGSQRSGTTMIADVFAKSPDCEVFLGDKRRLVFQGASRLVPMETIAKLVNDSPKRIAVFKPNNDLQYANVFLGFHPNSRIVWVYRDYRDAINSSIRRWGSAHRDIMLGISKGRILHPGQAAIAEGVSEALLAVLRSLCHDDLSVEDGAALLWYVRNSLYFDLHLARSERVLLVNYEACVQHPDKYFACMFEFVGAKFKPGYSRGVFDSSIGKQAEPALGKDVEALCRAMMAELDAQHAAGFPHGEHARSCAGSA
jgi:hypothetical protein